MKCYTKPIITDQQDFNKQDLARVYVDIRLEVKKLTSIDHPNIVQFLGLCVVSFSFLLEWAPMGDLDQTINKYEHSGFLIRPDIVANTILQVANSYYVNYHVLDSGSYVHAQ